MILNQDQAWLLNEAEALAQAAHGASQSITIPSHERGKHGRKKLDAALPRVRAKGVGLTSAAGRSAL